MSQGYSLVKLFNESIVIELPDDGSDRLYTSATLVRQVPSHQEVFLNTVHVNTSVIVEIVEALKEEHGGQLLNTKKNICNAVMHFEALADDNDADNFDIDQEYAMEQALDQTSPEPLYKEAIKGVQHIWKRTTCSMDTVRIWLGVARLEKFDADILVTLNCGDEQVDEDTLQGHFEHVFKSLQVLDDSLFQYD